jgi:hypothetical protein
MNSAWKLNAAALEECQKRQFIVVNMTFRFQSKLAGTSSHDLSRSIVSEHCAHLLAGNFTAIFLFLRLF